MMLSFSVTKPRKTLERQWAFLLEKVQTNRRDQFKNSFIGLLLATFVYLLFYFMTVPNNYIVPKGVFMFMLALAWIALIIAYPLSGLGKKKKRRRLQQFLDSILDIQLSYSVEIDDEKVVIISNEQAQKFPWADFTGYGINNDTVYIFNAARVANSLYWDKSEIGNEAYSGLLDMLKKKQIRQAF